MPRHHEHRVLPYTPEQMFDLVADVGRYAEFLPWVSAVRVREDAPALAVADLIVGFRGLSERFTSRVKKDRPRAIDVEYIEGPLSRLSNCWRFAAHPHGCEVDFSVDFAFRNRLFETIAGQMFNVALSRMVGAFETRAAKLYGSSNSSALSAA